jgi:hypothetical protein
MISDLKEGLINLIQAKGLRNALWLMLIIGIALLIFESITQYFTVSSLQSRTNLLTSIAQLSSDTEAKAQIINMQKELIEEAKIAQSNLANPSSYLSDKVLRFVKGAYLSLPLFYLVGKFFLMLLRTMKEEKQRTFVMFIGSIFISTTTWFATILGAISVIWNNSDSIVKSWFVFPIVSFFVFLPFALWLGLLRIVMPGTDKRELKEPK